MVLNYCFPGHENFTRIVSRVTPQTDVQQMTGITPVHAVAVFETYRLTLTFSQQLQRSKEHLS